MEGGFGMLVGIQDEICLFEHFEKSKEQPFCRLCFFRSQGSVGGVLVLWDKRVLIRQNVLIETHTDSYHFANV